MCCTCFSRCLRHRTPSPDLRFHPISLDHPRDTPVLTATPSPPASTSTTSTASPTRPHPTQSPTMSVSLPLSLTLHLSLLLQGYSFPANQYPFLTIVISLKVTAYVQSLSLGPQSNVQRYGLRLYNPARNVDDTYYSSTDSTSGQPMISGIPMAKVAVRLYINLYTTSDGRPPSNLQLTFVSRGGWYL